MNRFLLPFLAAVTAISAASSADAFWIARGWRGGVAAGRIRPPIVAREMYYPRCWRCAPVYPAGALAGAAVAGAAVAAGAAAATAPNPPPPAATAAAPANSAVAQAAAPNAAAAQCANGLPADSKMIYEASVRNMKGLGTLRETVTEQTRSLVMAGKISQAAARPAAEKAGTCLRLMAE